MCFIYALGVTPGVAKAEDVKSGTLVKMLEKATITFLISIDVFHKQVTAGTMLRMSSSELSSAQLKVNGSSLVVTSTGNVGIGTTSPQAKLEVSGNIIAARPTTTR